MSEELKNQLEEKRQKAIECRDSFQELKRQVARHAEYARTGKKIPEKIIQEVEEFELDKDAEVEKVRITNIKFRMHLRKLEKALKEKEQLAEGLHLIDFEQLKIENQTLNEKIEERNEELLKLRKKNTQTVQVLTHIKEKLQFVQADNQLQKDRLADLETDLAVQRDLLAGEKKNLDTIRQDRVKLKEKSGLVDSDDLLYDFEKTKDRIGELRDELMGCKIGG